MWFHYQDERPGEVGGMINLDHVIGIGAWDVISDAADEDKSDNDNSVLCFETNLGTHTFYYQGEAAKNDFRVLVETMKKNNNPDYVYDGDLSEIYARKFIPRRQSHE